MWTILVTRRGWCCAIVPVYATFDCFLLYVCEPAKDSIFGFFSFEFIYEHFSFRVQLLMCGIWFIYSAFTLILFKVVHVCNVISTRKKVKQGNPVEYRGDLWGSIPPLVVLAYKLRHRYRASGYRSGECFMRENGKCPGPETGTGLTEGGHLRRVKD